MGTKSNEVVLTEVLARHLRDRVYSDLYDKIMGEVKSDFIEKISPHVREIINSVTLERIESYANTMDLADKMNITIVWKETGEK